jgi:hypothetical protein
MLAQICVSFRKRLGPTVLSILLVAIVASLGVLWKGCQGLPKYIANCPVTPTAPSDISSIPPPTEPPPTALCGFPLTISAPGQGTTVNSPANFTAQAQAADQLYWMRVYVDNVAIYYSYTPTINEYLFMEPGQHTIEVVAEDVAGYVATATTQVNVTQEMPGVAGIQNLPGWQSCSAVLQNGFTCAAGLGTATSQLIQGQSSPSLDGTSAEFTLGGPHPYSNELYWYTLGGGHDVSHFSYDLWFYVNVGDAPQSLEFDVNQAFSGTRWTWGTQCDFNQTGEWNIWDPLHGVWVPIPIPCKHFPSQTWIHLVWNFERVGNQVHYISLSVADNTYNVDIYYNAQPKWYQEGINIQFQMDGNYEQQPYNVWLDEVNLNAY